MDAVDIARGEVIGAPSGELLYGATDTHAKTSKFLVWDDLAKTLKITGSITLLDSAGQVMGTFTDDKPEPQDNEDYWKQVAAGRLGVSAANLSWHYHNHQAKGEIGLNFAVASGGTSAGIAKALRLSTGGGANGTAFLTTGNQAGGRFPNFFINGATEKWWLAGEYALETAIGAATVLGVGGFSTSEQLFMGGRGATSTARFFLFGSANIDSGVNLDTNNRVHEAWRDGVNSFYTPSSPLDTTPGNPARVTPIVGTTQPSANCMLGAEAFDTAATLRTMAIKWWACATTR